MASCWTLDWTMVGAILALTAPRMAKEFADVYMRVKNRYATPTTSESDGGGSGSGTDRPEEGTSQRGD